MVQHKIRVKPIPWWKRGLDVGLVLITAPLWLPLVGIISLLIWWGLGRPIFFVQERIGYGGKRFRLLKFRTMTEERDSRGELLPDEKRLTKLGRWLRRTSLDELPELFHVLRGEMSLVGPRPLLPEYLPLYNEEQIRRHEVLPGLTGWAQVRGRNAVDWETRFALDVWYVDHMSVGLDLKILLMTLWKVLRGEGIQAPGHATMPKFTGSSAAGDQR